MSVFRREATGPGRRDVVVAGLASVAGGALPLAGATFEPWVVAIGLVGSGLIVGVATRGAGWIGIAGAAAGSAVAGWLRPGTLGGRESGPMTILIAAAVVALLFFSPGWLLGTARRTSGRPANARSGAAPGYAVKAAAILAIPVGLLLLWLVILARGGGCCP